MRRDRRITGLLGAALLAVLAVVVGRRWRESVSARSVAALDRAATPDREATVTAKDFTDLPDPVRDYLRTALSEGQPFVDSVRLEQTGRLRLGDDTTPWKPFTATQHVTTAPPGFLWSAAIEIAPFVPVWVRDLYCDGAGAASVSLFGVLPLDRAETSPELEEAELMRYLAEAVWYPTALLPRAGVSWDPIDDSTARATVDHGDTSVSLTVSFTDENTVERVHADARYRRVDDGYEPTPWTGRWHDYERRDGMLVPTAGEVVWHLPDGDVVAWEGELTAVEYDR